MAFAQYFLYALETLFFLGLAGSAVVVLLSFVEDARELFGKE